MNKKSYADQCLDRAEKATPGPWVRYHYAAWDGIEDSRRLDICCFSSSDWEADDHIPSNIEFIINARTDVPELARRLKLACEYLRACDYRIGNKLVADELETPLTSE